jgi:hypothetical protein
MERMVIMTIKLTKAAKALVNSASRRLKSGSWLSSDEAGPMEMLVLRCCQGIDHLWQEEMYEEFGPYVSAYVNVDDIKGLKSANFMLLDVSKMRDFQVPDPLFNSLNEVHQEFYGDWVVTSEGRYRGNTMHIDKDSAWTQCVVAEIIQFLCAFGDKKLLKPDELLKVHKGNGALSEYSEISGQLWVMCKTQAGDTHGLAFITHFVINLIENTTSLGQVAIVDIEDRCLDRDDHNYNADFEFDDLER